MNFYFLVCLSNSGDRSLTWLQLFYKSKKLLLLFSHSVMFIFLWPHGLQHTTYTVSLHSLLKLMFIESVMPSNHPILCHSLILLPLIFHSIRVFSKSISSLNQIVKVLELQLQHQSFQCQDWFPLGLTGWISLQPKGLSRVSSNTTVKKHQFFGAQLRKRDGNTYCRQRTQSTETL